MSNYGRSITKVVSLLLVLFLLAPGNAYAADDIATAPRASYYLTSYNTYIYNASWGKIQVWFDVTGVNYMDDIGVLTIKVYESTDNETWTWVKTYKHDTTSGMLAEDTVYHSGYVEYQGTIGRYYKAYVTIWAGKDGGGDTRYMWTQPKKATLLAG